MKKIITALFLVMLSVTTIIAQDYVVEPENNSVVEALTDIYITWENATTINVEPTLMVGGIKAYVVDGENKVFVTDVFCGPAFGNYIMLTMMSATTDAGSYVIEVPDNMFTVDEAPVPAFTLNYTIPGIPVSTATFDVTLDNNSLNTIHVSVSPCEVLLLNQDTEVEPPFIIHNAGFESYRAATYTVTITGANTATLTTDATFASGSFALHIPKGTFLVDEKLSPQVYSEFDVAGVNTVSNDADAVNVYSINGVQLINNGTDADLNRLQPGVYIVNGEKKFVRRNK